MTVHELSKDQILALKQAYLCAHQDSVSWGELIDADSIITDKEIMEIYADTNFTEDDFSQA